MRPHDPLRCIVPEHMLEHIARHARTQHQRDVALRSLTAAARFRGQRDAFSLTSAPPASGEKQRKIFDAKHGITLPGTLIRSEGEPPTGDEAADEVYRHLGATYDLFEEVYGRNSLDDNGHPLNATVHYGDEFNNAFWNGQQMVFGDGDGELFLSFTNPVDITGHELSHGVVEFTANLVYHHQPGALNEHFADVFGSLVKQRVLGQTADQADWLIGEGLLGPEVNGVALRSMKAPGTAYDDDVLGKDPQPGHMKHYYEGPQDNYGVHINSGIPNRAFYLAATAIGGEAWEVAGMIWYQTLLSLSSHAEFSDAAAKTIQAASEFGSDVQQSVRDAWKEVGVTVPRSPRRRTAAAAARPADQVEEQFDELIDRMGKRVASVIREEFRKQKNK